MFFGTTVLDNFYTDPYKIIKRSKDFKFTYSDDGRWPGQRTELVHKIDYNLFYHTCVKILSVLYPTEYLNLQFNASQHFQKINLKDYDNGWVHNDGSDNNLFTAIIYLSNHEDCGTSLFHLKKNNFEALYANEISPVDYYLDLKDKKKREKDKELCAKNNAQYEETIRINSRLNRLICFDSNHPHAAHDFKNSKLKKEPRLTLITFFREITRRDGTRIYFPSQPNGFHY
tara:strand:+ start:358 stop:1044 length:687 start_codon:yes stop_codon:yes gene_type:complete